MNLDARRFHGSRGREKFSARPMKSFSTKLRSGASSNMPRPRSAQAEASFGVAFSPGFFKVAGGRTSRPRRSSEGDRSAMVDPYILL
jgi:hypothetical protein